MPLVDDSWSETVLYVCRCGTMYAARRWRWIDAEVRPGVAQRVTECGPWDGQCPACGQVADAPGSWVRVSPQDRRATLVLPTGRRGDLIAELREHLAAVERRAQAVPLWLTTPTVAFEDPTGARPGLPRREETTARRSMASMSPDKAPEPPPEPATVVPPATTEPVQVAEPQREIEPVSAPLPPPREPPPTPDAGTEPQSPRTPPPRSFLTPPPAIPAPRTLARPPVVDDEMGLAPLPPRPAVEDDPEAGVPQIIGLDSPSPEVGARPASIGAHVADLTLDEVVAFRIRVSSEQLPQWEAARLSARPIHLRGRGYPLVGVRVVGSYMGQVGCIDAVVDVGSTLATDAFRRLSEQFSVTLVIEHGSREISRTIEASGLEPNAALCVESARGILARGEYPPQEFDKARRALEAEPADVRLARAEVTIASGDYQHIIGAREAVAALEHLERVSQKETLARLLEVDGLPMAEYDLIRRRVLEGSLAHGLCAPRRFWRRLVASGLARDLDDYAERLCANRSEHEGEEGDLDPDAAHEAWVAIHGLCERKNITPPAALRAALELPEPDAPAASPPPPPRRQASGEIRSGEIQSGTMPPPLVATSAGPLGSRLRDPGQRLRAATEVLQGHASAEDLGQVIDALEEFETGELLALLPDLNELGPRAVPGLLAKLQSERREVRQAAAILLGMSRQPHAMERLAEHLVWEPTTVWLDVARALGWFGTAAIRSLCQLLAQEAATPREQLAIDRVARALAEVAVAQGSALDTQTGRDAVRALAEAADPRVSTAARRAMASLAEVTSSGAQMRGEIPLSEVTEVRAFARRAYEAIMVPELEVEAEA
ncbi:MAG: HEAT repeat domain-containing protein [Deltaproteobacteria bacterium]|nr:HEAT repeat domain-containing protein [Deltaproteobacteria bacterium]